MCYQAAAAARKKKIQQQQQRDRQEAERLRKQAARAGKAAANRAAIVAAGVDQEVGKWRARAEEAERFASKQDMERKREKAVAAAVEDLKVRSCLAF